MEQKQLVQLPVIITGMSLKADKSWKLAFETRELGGDEIAILTANLQAEGWLVYKPNEIRVEDVPKGEADSGTKSQSKRLRDVTFILWKQLGEKNDFESFYRMRMEELIEVIKAKLEPED